MLLALDIGNTNIVAGLFAGEELVASWRFATRHDQTSDELAALLSELLRLRERTLRDVGAVIVSSVVPALTPTACELSRRHVGVEPLIVGPGIRTGIQIEYEDPREVGADRIANAIAAFERYGGPTIVVDFGTATTFDAISPTGNYLGGAIAPGIVVSADALFLHAARLPKVELLRPAHAIGRNTVASMQSGLVFGYVGLVKELVARFQEEVGGSARVVATGGLCELIASEVDAIHEVDPLLTLRGLHLLWKRNSAPSGSAAS